MEHIAILKKEWNLLKKIENKEKTIESRWYKNKSSPWDKIKQKNTIYFKEGTYVSIKATAGKVIQFSDLTKEKIKSILDEYGKYLGIENIKDFENSLIGKKYCILIFLENINKIEPFAINKKGFGNMCSWICVDDINKIKQIKKQII